MDYTYMKMLTLRSDKQLYYFEIMLHLTKVFVYIL